MKNILVVDDNYSFLLGLSMNLCVYLRDCNVLTAENSGKAIEMMKFLPVDCLVTGLGMPSVEGYELVRSVRRNYPGLPVFVMTDACGQEMERKLASLGASRCVAKPPDLKVLSGLIASELSACSLVAA
jgi:CheY-like chemotaxis protein